MLRQHSSSGRPAFGGWFLFLFPILIISAPASSQIFHLQGGGSTLIDAQGGSIEFEAQGYSGAIGGGLINGRFEYGAVLRTEFHGYKLVAGDEVLRFDLPTDIFNNNHYFYSRGAGFRKSWENSSLSVFGGMTSSFLGAPYFKAARPSNPFGLVFYDRKLAPGWRFVARSILTEKSTFLAGVEYAPSKTFAAALTGGSGANAPYGAVSVFSERTWLSLRANYIYADKGFRRVKAQEPVVAETDRENITLDLRPTTRFTIHLARQNILFPLDNSPKRASRAVTNSGGVNFSLFHTQIGSSVYLAESEGVANRGVTFSAYRGFGTRISGSFNYYRNRPDKGAPSTSYTFSVREQVVRRLQLAQYLTRSNGQTTFSFGGDFNSNRFSVGVSHDTSYVPFRPASAGGPWVNVYNVHFAVRPFGNTEINGQTNVAPDGKVRWSIAGSQYIYRYAGLTTGGRSPKLRIGVYVIKGRVLDDEGQPIAGAAIRIGDQEAFSDTDGVFLARFSKRGAQPVHVALEDFLTTAYYEVVTAPAAADSAPEDQAQEITIRLKRVKPPVRIKPEGLDVPLV